MAFQLREKLGTNFGVAPLRLFNTLRQRTNTKSLSPSAQPHPHLRNMQPTKNHPAGRRSQERMSLMVNTFHRAIGVIIVACCVMNTMTTVGSSYPHGPI